MAEPVEMVAVQQAEPVPAPAEVQPEPPTAEQVRAADAVFSADPEAATAAGVIGLWGSVQLLHDLALDHLPRPEEEKRKKRPG